MLYDPEGKASFLLYFTGSVLHLFIQNSGVNEKQTFPHLHLDIWFFMWQRCTYFFDSSPVVPVFYNVVWLLADSVISLFLMQWVPPNLSVPILNLVDVVFQLKDGGWIRFVVFSPSYLNTCFFSFSNFTSCYFKSGTCIHITPNSM